MDTRFSQDGNLVVSSVTSSTRHMLDLVICDDVSNLIDRVSVEEEFTISPVHKRERERERDEEYSALVIIVH